MTGVNFKNVIEEVAERYGYICTEEMEEVYCLLQEGWKNEKDRLREEGDVVNETENYIVLSFSDSMVKKEVEDLANRKNINRELAVPISEVFHEMAKSLVDYNWSVRYPIVIEK